MSEAIYILTVIFFIYVVEVVLGEEIVALIRNVFRIDLHRPHLKYRGFRGSIANLRAKLSVYRRKK